MLLIPEQVSFLRKSILSLLEELKEYDDYFQDKMVKSSDETMCSNIGSSIIEQQFQLKVKQLQEYQKLLKESEYIKNIDTKKIEIGTRFILRFDEEESEEYIFLDSLMDPNMAINAVTSESPLGKNIIGKKEGDLFLYVVSQGATNIKISGIVEKIITKKREVFFIRNEKNRVLSRKATAERKMLRQQMEIDESLKEKYEERLYITESQRELLQEEKERLTNILRMQPSRLTEIKTRLQSIDRVLNHRKVAILPEDNSIGIGSNFSIMFFGDSETTIRRLELINWAVGDELNDEYIERMSTLGYAVYGLKEGEEFTIIKNGKLVSGMVYHIDNHQDQLKTTSALAYQKRK